MRSAVTALAWEFWSANRRGWLILLAAIPSCAVLYRLLAGWLQESDGVRTLSFLPFAASLILAAAFCNFTDVNRRSGIAGFPQHLFARPVNCHLLITCLMACAVLSVVGIYMAWAKLVYQPAGIELLVSWPATLLAVGIVLYQAIIWCMSNFRLTRIVVMSVMVTVLVGVGFLPYMPSQNPPSQASLSIILCLVAVAAYGATVFSIGLERRGSGFASAWSRALVERVVDAVPRRKSELASPERALFWFEWRRSGLILPLAVLLTTLLVMGPLLSLTGRGEDATLRAVIWLSIMPLLMAGPVGKGLAKPDFWSLELALSPFFAARPITCSQIIAAKLKLAAWSTLLAWSALIVVAVPWLVGTCDLKHLRELWATLNIVYSPLVLWPILLLSFVAALLVTWSFLVSALWMGYSGRTGAYYTYVGISLISVFAFAMCFGIWLDTPQNRGEIFLAIQHWIPWGLAALFTFKCWLSVAALAVARRSRLASNRAVASYLCFWLLATGTIVLLACLMSPRVEWLRNLLILVALLAVPSARIVAAPLAVARNRHG